MLEGRANSCIFRHKGPLRVIAIITMWSFLFSTGGGNLLVENAWAAKRPKELTTLSSKGDFSSSVPNKEFNVETFALPHYLGNIKESWTPDHQSTGGANSRTIIHIQDAHCNYACQHKIADIIQYLNKEYAIDMVNLEGGAGDYDLSLFTTIDDDETREKVSDYFVKEGLVNGSEYFAINNIGKVALWGIEDVNLYIKNLKVYRDSLLHKEQIEKYLKELDHILGNLKRHIYSKELLQIDERYSQYKANNLEFKDYLTYLTQKAKSKDMDIKSFINIYLLKQALELEEGIDFDQADAERYELIKKLENTLSKRELEELVVKTIEFKTERISQDDFYRYLLKKAKWAELELEDFPQLQGYIVYISIYETIDKSKIMMEIAQLEEEIKGLLYQNDKQRQLNKLAKNLALKKNLFNITLTKDDYAYYQKNRASFDTSAYVSFLNREAPLYKIRAGLDSNIRNLDDYREDIAKFYEYSFKRDDTFLRNIKFQNRGHQTSILVTGGFHTENLCELFKKKGISFVSIIPNFKNEKGYACPYFNLLSGEVASFIKQIDAAISSMQLASVWNELGETVDGYQAELARIGVMAYEFLFRAQEDLAVRIAIDKKDGWIIFNMTGEEPRCEFVRSNDPRVTETENGIQFEGKEINAVKSGEEILKAEKPEHVLWALGEIGVDYEMERLSEDDFEDIVDKDLDAIIHELKQFVEGIGASQEVSDQIEMLKGNKILGGQGEGQDGNYWHGGNRYFEKFDEHFMGAGVGAQQEGWGFSLAGRIQAAGYASLVDVKLPPGQEPIVVEVRVNGKDSEFFKPRREDPERMRNYYVRQLIDNIRDGADTVEDARANMLKELQSVADQNESGEHRSQVEAYMRFFDSVDISVSIPRFLYQVSVGENPKWLDLEESVDAATWRVIEDRALKEKVEFDEGVKLTEGTLQVHGRLAKGRDVYGMLIEILGSPKEASLFLDRAGFTGNKSGDFYLAYPSRLKIIQAIDMNAQKDLGGSSIQPLVRLVKGVNFRGHAGGQGIRLNIDLKKDKRELKAALLHEIIAGIFGDHLLARKVEQAFLTNETDEEILKDVAAFDEPVWEMDDETRREAKRDYASKKRDPKRRKRKTQPKVAQGKIIESEKSRLKYYMVPITSGLIGIILMATFYWINRAENKFLLREESAPPMIEIIEGPSAPITQDQAAGLEGRDVYTFGTIHVPAYLIRQMNIIIAGGDKIPPIPDSEEYRVFRDSVEDMVWKPEMQKYLKLYRGYIEDIKTILSDPSNDITIAGIEATSRALAKLKHSLETEGMSRTMSMLRVRGVDPKLADDFFLLNHGPITYLVLGGEGRAAQDLFKGVSLIALENEALYRKEVSLVLHNEKLQKDIDRTFKKYRTNPQHVMMLATVVKKAAEREALPDDETLKGTLELFRGEGYEEIKGLVNGILSNNEKMLELRKRRDEHMVSILGWTASKIRRGRIFTFIGEQHEEHQSNLYEKQGAKTFSKTPETVKKIRAERQFYRPQKKPPQKQPLKGQPRGKGVIEKRGGRGSIPVLQGLFRLAFGETKGDRLYIGFWGPFIEEGIFSFFPLWLSTTSTFALLNLYRWIPGFAAIFVLAHLIRGPKGVDANKSFTPFGIAMFVFTAQTSLFLLNYAGVIAITTRFAVVVAGLYWLYHLWINRSGRGAEAWSFETASRYLSQSLAALMLVGAMNVSMARLDKQVPRGIDSAKSTPVRIFKSEVTQEGLYRWFYVNENGERVSEYKGVEQHDDGVEEVFRVLGGAIESEGFPEDVKSRILSDPERCKAVEDQDSVKLMAVAAIIKKLNPQENIIERLKVGNVEQLIDEVAKPLVEARFSGREETQLLVALDFIKTADIRQFSDEGRDRAVQGEERYILGYGENPDELRKAGETPFFEKNTIALIDEFFREGTDLNQPELLAETILHEALEAVTQAGTHRDLYTGVQRQIFGENELKGALRGFIDNTVEAGIPSKEVVEEYSAMLALTEVVNELGIKAGQKPFLVNRLFAEWKKATMEGDGKGLIIPYADGRVFAAVDRKGQRISDLEGILLRTLPDVETERYITTSSETNRMLQEYFTSQEMQVALYKERKKQTETPGLTYPGRLIASQSVIREVVKPGNLIVDVGVGEGLFGEEGVGDDKEKAPTFRELKKALDDTVQVRGIELMEENIPSDLKDEILKENIFDIGKEGHEELTELIHNADVIRMSNIVVPHFSTEQKQKILLLLSHHMKEGAKVVISHSPGGLTMRKFGEEGFLYQKKGHRLVLHNFLYAIRVESHPGRRERDLYYKGNDFSSFFNEGLEYFLIYNPLEADEHFLNRVRLLLQDSSKGTDEEATQYVIENLVSILKSQGIEAQQIGSMISVPLQAISDKLKGKSRLLLASVFPPGQEGSPTAVGGAIESEGFPGDVKGRILSDPERCKVIEEQDSVKLRAVAAIIKRLNPQEDIVERLKVGNVEQLIDDVAKPLIEAKFSGKEETQLLAALEFIKTADIRQFSDEGRDRAVQGEERYVLGYGENPDELRKAGETPFFERNTIALIDEFFREGTDLNQPELLAETILHEALEAVTEAGTHRDLYTGVQRTIFGEDNVLKRYLRAYIQVEFAAEEAREIVQIVSDSRYPMDIHDNILPMLRERSRRLEDACAKDECKERARVLFFLQARLTNYSSEIEETHDLFESLRQREPMQIIEAMMGKEIHFYWLAMQLVKLYAQDNSVLLPFMAWFVSSGEHGAAQVLYAEVERNFSRTEPLSRLSGEIRRASFPIYEMLEARSGEVSDLENERLRRGRSIIKEKGLLARWDSSIDLETALRGLSPEEALDVASVYFKDNYAIKLVLITTEVPRKERPQDGSNRPVEPVRREDYRNLAQYLQEWSKELDRIPRHLLIFNEAFEKLIVAKKGRASQGYHRTYESRAEEAGILLTMDDNSSFTLRHELGHAIDPDRIVRSMAQISPFLYQGIDRGAVEQFARDYGYGRIVFTGEAKHDVGELSALLTRMFENRRDAWKFIKGDNFHYDLNSNSRDILIAFREYLISEREEIKRALETVDNGFRHPFLDPETDINAAYDRKIQQIDEDMDDLSRDLSSCPLEKRMRWFRVLRPHLPEAVTGRLTLYPNIVFGDSLSDFEKKLHNYYTYEIPKDDQGRHEGIEDESFSGVLRERHHEWFAERVRLFLSYPDILELIDKEFSELMGYLFAGVSGEVQPQALVRDRTDILGGAIESEGFPGGVKSRILDRARPILQEDAIAVKLEVLGVIIDKLNPGQDIREYVDADDVKGLAEVAKGSIEHNMQVRDGDKPMLYKAIDFIKNAELKQFLDGREAVQGREKYFLGCGIEETGTIALIDEFFKKGSELNAPELRAEVILHEALEAQTVGDTHQLLYRGVQRQIFGENILKDSLRRFIDTETIVNSLDQPQADIRLANIKDFQIKMRGRRERSPSNRDPEDWVEELFSNRDYVIRELQALFPEAVIDTAAPMKVFVEPEGHQSGGFKDFNVIHLSVGEQTYKLGVFIGIFMEGEIMEKRMLSSKGIGPRIGNPVTTDVLEQNEFYREFVNPQILTVQHIEGETISRMLDNGKWEEAFDGYVKVVGDLKKIGFIAGDITNMRNTMVDRRTGKPYLIDHGHRRMAGSRRYYLRHIFDYMLVKRLHKKENPATVQSLIQHMAKRGFDSLYFGYPRELVEGEIRGLREKAKYFRELPEGGDPERARWMDIFAEALEGVVAASTERGAIDFREVNSVPLKINGAAINDEVAEKIADAVSKTHTAWGEERIERNCPVLSRILGRKIDDNFDRRTTVHILKCDRVNEKRDGVEPEWSEFGWFHEHSITYFVIDGFHFTIDLTAKDYSQGRVDAEIFVAKSLEGLRDMLCSYYGGLEWNINDTLGEHNFRGTYPSEWRRSYVTNFDLRDEKNLATYNAIRTFEHKYGRALETAEAIIRNGGSPSEENMRQNWEAWLDMQKFLHDFIKYPDIDMREFEKIFDAYNIAFFYSQTAEKIAMRIGRDSYEFSTGGNLIGKLQQSNGEIVKGRLVGEENAEGELVISSEALGELTSVKVREEVSMTDTIKALGVLLDKRITSGDLTELESMIANGISNNLENVKTVKSLEDHFVDTTDRANGVRGSIKGFFNTEDGTLYLNYRLLESFVMEDYRLEDLGPQFLHEVGEGFILRETLTNPLKPFIDQLGGEPFNLEESGIVHTVLRGVGKDIREAIERMLKRRDGRGFDDINALINALKEDQRLKKKREAKRIDRIVTEEEELLLRFNFAHYRYNENICNGLQDTLFGSAIVADRIFIGEPADFAETAPATNALDDAIINRIQEEAEAFIRGVEVVAAAEPVEKEKIFDVIGEQLPEFPYYVSRALQDMSYRDMAIFILEHKKELKDWFLHNKFKKYIVENMGSINIPPIQPTLSREEAGVMLDRKIDIEEMTEAVFRRLEHYTEDSREFDFMSTFFLNPQQTSVFIGARPAAITEKKYKPEEVQKIRTAISLFNEEIRETGRFFRLVPLEQFHGFLLCEEGYLLRELRAHKDVLIPSGTDGRRKLIPRSKILDEVEAERDVPRRMEKLQSVIDDLGHGIGVVLGYGVNNTRAFLFERSIRAKAERLGLIPVIEPESPSQKWYISFILSQYFSTYPDSPLVRDNFSEEEIDIVHRATVRWVRSFEKEFVTKESLLRCGLEGEGRMDFAAYYLAETNSLVGKYKRMFSYAKAHWEKLKIRQDEGVTEEALTTKIAAASQYGTAEQLIKDLAVDWSQNVVDYVIDPVHPKMKSPTESVDHTTNRVFRRNYGSDTVVEGYAYEKGDRREDIEERIITEIKGILGRMYANDNEGKNPQALIAVPAIFKNEDIQGMLDKIFAESEYEQYAGLRDNFIVQRLEAIPEDGLMDEVLHISFAKGLLNYVRHEKKGAGGDVLQLLASNLSRFLEAYVSNYDEIVYTSGVDPREIVKSVLTGDVTLRIKQIDWESIKAWRKAQNAILQAL